MSHVADSQLTMSYACAVHHQCLDTCESSQKNAISTAQPMTDTVKSPMAQRPFGRRTKGVQPWLSGSSISNWLSDIAFKMIKPMQLPDAQAERRQRRSERGRVDG
jgi:hypothetical protein